MNRAGLRHDEHSSQHGQRHCAEREEQKDLACSYPGPPRRLIDRVGLHAWRHFAWLNVRVEGVGVAERRG